MVGTILNGSGKQMLFRTALSCHSKFSLGSGILKRVLDYHGSSIYGVNVLHTDYVKMSSNRESNRWYSSCSSERDLSIKKCVPCNLKDMRPMTQQSASELISQVPGWNLNDEGGTLKLHRTWKVKSFTKGLEFLQLVANIAEAEGHHPDLHLVGWNNVKLEIWTHSVGV